MSRQDEEIVIEKHHHHWKMRLMVAIIMLGLSFIGLVVSALVASRGGTLL